jgi:hypothetical protein
MFVFTMQLRFLSKWPNLKLKTRPKQLLGSLPLAFALPGAINPSIFLRCLWLSHSWQAGWQRSGRKIASPSQGWGFESNHRRCHRRGKMTKSIISFISENVSNAESLYLKVKTRPKQLLGSLPLAFALHNAIDPSIFLRCLWLFHYWKAMVAQWSTNCLPIPRLRVRVQPPSLSPKRENDKQHHFIHFWKMSKNAESL